MTWGKTIDLNQQNTDSLYSLAFFRIVFGLIMTFAEIRFISKGWITDFYVKPEFFFSFYGLEWISPPSAPYVHWVFYAMVILTLCITLGFFYRFSIISFFLLFTWVEFWDKSVYLNHYYQVSLLTFLMCWLPMNAVCSLDNALCRRKEPIRTFFRNPENLLKIQVGMVYFFGGIAKIKYDWLFLAQPLKIWLAANEDFPVAGPLLTQPWVAYTISWLAMVFDLSAPFLLFFRPTRIWIYLIIVVFHLLTHFLFHIGMFPWIMMGTALIFFPSAWHRKILQKCSIHPIPSPRLIRADNLQINLFTTLMALFFGWQLLMPFRYLLYPGNVLWHEQGFRFSWNIMLMEKNGSAEFHVRVKETGKEFTVYPHQFLTPIQTRQMSFQPDMILQFVHYLHDYYQVNGIGDTEIRAECYAAVNGKGSALLIDPTVDLTLERDSFRPKTWITDYQR